MFLLQKMSLGTVWGRWETAGGWWGRLWIRDITIH
jgi:hypothetical protein